MHVLQVVVHLFCRKHDLVLELRRMCCLFNILAPIATNRHRQKRNAFPRLVKFNIGNLLLQKKSARKQHIKHRGRLAKVPKSRESLFGWEI